MATKRTKTPEPKRRGGCLRNVLIAIAAIFGCMVVAVVGSALLPAAQAPISTPKVIVVPTFTPTPVAVATEAPTVASTDVPLPAATPEPDTRGAAVVNPFSCAGGCATPPDGTCTIKGNVNNDGEKIFHTIGSGSYDRTDIKPAEGDAWFCTTDEAIAAGFRGAGD